MENMFNIKVDTSLKTEVLGTVYGSCTIPSNMFNKDSICYCVGAGEDISFDCELTKIYNSEVFIFDPTPRAKSHFEQLEKSVKNQTKMPIDSSKTLFYEINKEQLSRLKFLEYGIWKETKKVQFYAPQKKEYVSHSIVNLQKKHSTFEAQCYTVKDLMEKLNHKKIDLLKLDVEGAEYDVIDNLISSKLDIHILYIEFHEIENFIEKTKKSVKDLSQLGYKVIDIKKRDILFIKE
ncbi:FkbM family methyltransferase [Arcobacter sp.]|uniref:FkbM family methyltransferase n=1 Tax=Arcobacter sp. TaxID=1872629 RepID=UPI003C767755